MCHPLLLALLVLAGCFGKEDEAAARKREAAEIDARLDSWKIGLYRVVKTSVRALPPRETVHVMVKGKPSLTRDEWAALLEKDEALAPYRKRVGFFIVGA